MSERYVDLSPNTVIAVLALGLVGPIAVGAFTPHGSAAPMAPASAAPAPSAAPGAPSSSAAKGPSATIPAERLEAFKKLSAVMESKDNPVTEEKVALGRTLYFEARLSKNHDLSCASCHDLQKFGVDGKDVSDGHKGQKGSRNAPSVYNAALHVAQFWDGRAKDVEEQAGGPIVNPVEMAMKDEVAVVDVLRSIPDYKGLFEKAFPDDASPGRDPISYGNLKKAIGAFERKLVTPSRWDKFLDGEKAALTDDEKKGFNVFFEAGCVSCHSGEGVGGGSFQKLGAVKPWPNQKDAGKAEVSKSDADKMMFKVASLRNVEHTAPYFHDASAKTLEEAVKKMATHQLGKELPDADVKLLVGWLKTLSGELPAAYVKAPELPKSGDKTPKPDPG